MGLLKDLGKLPEANTLGFLLIFKKTLGFILKDLGISGDLKGGVFILFIVSYQRPIKFPSLFLLFKVNKYSNKCTSPKLWNWNIYLLFIINTLLSPWIIKVK